MGSRFHTVFSCTEQLPPGSSVHGILQTGIQKWLPFPSPGIFPTKGWDPSLLHWQVDSFSLSHQGSPMHATHSDKFSFYFYSVANIFWFFLLWLLVNRYTHVSKWTFNFQIHGVFWVLLILITHLDINFFFKYFLFCHHPLCGFSLLTSLSLSMAMSKISLGKCHIALENMWVIFKYLLTLISTIVS